MPMTGSDTTDDDAPDLGREIHTLLADPELWVEPPADLEDRIVMAIESESAPFEQPVISGHGRSWSSALLGAAAAVALLFGAVVVFSALDGADNSEVVALDLVPTGLVNDVEGTVEMTATDSGVRIELEAFGLPRRVDGAYYEAWLLTSSGDLVAVGTFHDGVDVVLWGGVHLSDVEAFSVTQEGTGDIDDSGATSSGRVVMKADLSARS